MRAVAIIPARGGSTRIPGKNKRLFYGRPIIEYSIDTAQATGLFDHVVVTTDDPEIAQIAIENGAIAMTRPAALADNAVGTQEVMKWALQRYQDVPAACCIYATSPMMSKHDLRVGFAILKAGACEYAYSTTHEGADAGQFYWGATKAFLDGIPLEGNSMHVKIDTNRVCDINTEADWQRAEAMYAKLMGYGRGAKEVDLSEGSR